MTTAKQRLWTYLRAKYPRAPEPDWCEVCLVSVPKSGKPARVREQFLRLVDNTNTEYLITLTRSCCQMCRATLLWYN
jgi:hypothetical protein